MDRFGAAITALLVAGGIFTYVIARGLIMVGDVLNKGLDEILAELKRRK